MYKIKFVHVYKVSSQTGSIMDKAAYFYHFSHLILVFILRFCLQTNISIYVHTYIKIEKNL